MTKRIIVSILLVAGMVSVSFAGPDVNSYWRNHSGDGNFCNAGNWDENPPADNECYLDSNGITHAACDININALKGPSYNTANITAELSSGKITIATNRYCRIGYYAGGGHLIISGGTLDARCNDGNDGNPGFAVGLFRQGMLTVTDGLVQAKILNLATPKPNDERGPYNGTTSVVNLSGGVIEADSLASATGQASFIISGDGVLVLPGNQSLGSLPGWVSFEGGEGVAEYDAPEYPGRTKFSIGGQTACACPGNITDDDQIDLQDLQGVADILLAAGTPFIVPAEPGDCADINADGQIDLEDLQSLAEILLAEGTPFIVDCP